MLVIYNMFVVAFLVASPGFAFGFTRIAYPEPHRGDVQSGYVHDYMVNSQIHEPQFTSFIEQRAVSADNYGSPLYTPAFYYSVSNSLDKSHRFDVPSKQASKGQAIIKQEQSQKSDCFTWTSPEGIQFKLRRTPHSSKEYFSRSYDAVCVDDNTRSRPYYSPGSVSDYVRLDLPDY